MVKERKTKENAVYFTASDGNPNSYLDFRSYPPTSFSREEALRLVNGSFPLSDLSHALDNLGAGK